MEFLNLTGLAFLTLGVPVVLLYLLRMRRLTERVPSTLLWREALEDLRSATPFRRLRRNLLLLLQLLIIALVALALARPLIQARRSVGQSMVVVLDGSASMLARDVDGESRFDAALAEARTLVRSLTPADEMMVVEAGTIPRTLSSFTADRAQLERALSRASARATRAAVAEALTLAAASLKDRAHPVIYLLSDGAFEGLDTLELPPDLIRLIPQGRGAENFGITALDYRPAADAVEIFAAVRNYSAARRTVLVSLVADGSGEVLSGRRAELGPGQEAPILFREPLAPGRYWLRLDPPDDLAEDSAAALVLAPEPELRVLVVGEGSAPLLRALNVDPLTRVAVLSTAQSLDVARDGEPVEPYRGGGDWDLVVFVGQVPEALPPSAVLVVAPSRAVAGVEVSGEVETPIIIDWDRDSPFLRFVQFADVHVARSAALRPGPGTRTLVESTEGPLLLQTPRAEGDVLVIGFDLMDSDWPLRASFPIFIANVLSEVRRTRGGAFRGAVATGSKVRLPLPADAAEVTVTTPSGRKHVLPVEVGGVTFTETTEVGFYQVRVGDSKRSETPRVQYFAADLLDAEESDIAPRRNLSLAGGPVEMLTSVTVANREIWGLFALAALVLVMLEWYCYHRRIE